MQGDNGSMWFWDWKSGHNFQQSQTIVQPGMYFVHFLFVLYGCGVEVIINGVGH